MKRLSILILCLLPALASDAPAEKSTRTFPLKYVDADQIRRLFSAYSYPMTANRDFNVLTVTAPAGFQTKVEEAIKEYDLQPVPARNIELTVYAVTGADAAAPVPKELQAIEKQFTAGGVYKGVRLIDTQVIRVRPGQPGESGSIRLRAAWVSAGDKNRVISLDGLKVNFKTATISTDIDIPEGQAVVIGKAGTDGLLVAAAKVAE
jgi:hypothetical protein